MSKQRQDRAARRKEDDRDIFDKALDAPVLPYALIPAGVFVGGRVGRMLGRNSLRRWYGKGHKEKYKNSSDYLKDRKTFEDSGALNGGILGGAAGFMTGVGILNRQGGAVDRGEAEWAKPKRKTRK